VGVAVEVEQGPAPAMVRVMVRDTGPGIAPDDLPHVFDRFYQADPARDRSTGSSGLGLAIVRALVEAQGGRVGAENAPGGGALIWFELPAA
jgi:two-component system sensor histidine kinase BaeS